MMWVCHIRKWACHVASSVWLQKEIHKHIYMHALISKCWMLDHIRICLSSFTAIKDFSGAESHGVSGSGVGG